MTTTSTAQARTFVDDGRVRLVKGLSAGVGALFLVIGIAGFLVTGFDRFAEHTNEMLLVFEVNPLHNLVHLLIGVAGLALARTLSGARTFGWILAAAYGLTLVYGLFVVDNRDPNFLSINWADNWLHLAAVLVGLVIALLPVRRRHTAAHV